MDEEFMLPSQRRKAAPAAPAAPASPAPQQAAAKEEQFTLPSQVRNKPNYETMPASDVAGRALANLPKNAWDVTKETASAFLPENIPETAMGLGNLAYGAVSKGLNALGVQQEPKERAQHEEALDKLLKHYGDKYGSLSGVKQAIAERPAEVIADLSAVATGATPAMVRGLPGAAGQLARATRTVGELGTPIVGPAKVVGKVAEAVSPITNAAMAPIAGVSARSLNDAAKAGVTSDPSFWRAMSGEITAHDIINDVDAALSKVAKERSDKYVAGMSDLSKTAVLPFDPIDKAVSTIDKLAYSGPAKVVKNPDAVRAAQEIRDTVDAWKQAAQSDPYYSSIHGFDELKQAISNISKTYRGTPADKAVSDVAKAVKAEIQKIDPQYAEVMDSYATMTDELNELRKELLGSDRLTTGAKMRKLLKAQGSKYKTELIDELMRRDPSLGAKISGMEVNQAHGHAGEATIGGLISLILEHPELTKAAVVGAAIGSPARAAKTAAAIKQGMFLPEQAGRAAGKMSPVVGAVHLLEDEKRPGRAAGGAVGITADRLIAMAKASRRKIQGRSKAILAQPDEHVVSALKAVNKQMQGQ